MVISIKSQHNGMTLIEVLIALVIVTIAMTAIIKATSQTLRAHAYLKDKTIAMWVAMKVINEIKINKIILGEGDGLNQTETMLNNVWDWRAKMKSTPEQQINKIIVTVYRHANDVPLFSMEGYRYQPKT